MGKKSSSVMPKPRQASGPTANANGPASEDRKKETEEVVRDFVDAETFLPSDEELISAAERPMSSAKTPPPTPATPSTKEVKEALDSSISATAEISTPSTPPEAAPRTTPNGTPAKPATATKRPAPSTPTPAAPPAATAGTAQPGPSPAKQQLAGAAMHIYTQLSELLKKARHGHLDVRSITDAVGYAYWAAGAAGGVALGFVAGIRRAVAPHNSASAK